MGELVGRESDCAQIDRLLETAHGGDSGSLVVRGEAGIGKTALLAYAGDRAETMTVLRCTGVESESDLVFAGLYGLVRPVLGHLGEVADRQSAALTGALGLAPSAGADRFLISAALLSLLAAAAEARPVLCVVDDAQWLDTASAGALVSTARRLRAERVAMLFAARDGDPRRFEAPGLRELVLAGLDDSSAAALLARHLPDAAANVQERLLTEAAGNPPALLELPAGLSPGQLAGQDPLPEALPLTARLQAAFAQKIAAARHDPAGAADRRHRRHRRGAGHPARGGTAWPAARCARPGREGRLDPNTGWHDRVPPPAGAIGATGRRHAAPAAARPCGSLGGADR